MRNTVAVVVVLIAGLGLSACDQNASSSAQNAAKQATPETPQTVLGKSAKMGRDIEKTMEQANQQALQAANAATGQGDFVTVGPLQVPVPAGWERVQLAPGGMRAAEFKVAGEDGPGSVVFFANIGGDVASNLNRWAGQVKGADGSAVKAEPKVKTYGNLKVHTIALEGTYAGMTPMGGAASPQPNTRFLGAIIEGAGAPVQARFTGPIATVRAAERAWEDMLAGLQVK